ncbi:uncharacterized protein BDZ99DRAFT_401604 [Mytilinidion resinicola]|uniref:Zn(2)-C6 fungal-type domain-containing protein n=1 Tax=Mytilinidion resinicola TaxID=574789 RepID=A0A6A6Y0R6_9PEZI|nr:uncharacterized protein BDZ99DRAFT_401604 [Mytilinidion resinicola]KAF2802401.1 hypothetical protein BDZ99DRAFT_401604 [Mytilinidion resinicola]
MPKYQQTHGVPRQRPVSCRSCRARKLRCSREAPCTNCVARGLHCELDNPAASPPRNNQASESEVIERIRKLEELVESQRSQRNGSLKPITKSYSHQMLQTPMYGFCPGAEHLDKDVAWLASIYSGLEVAEKIPSNKVVFRICPIQHIMEAQSYIFLSPTSVEPSRCIWLPQYPEAKILLDKFIEDIDGGHHVVHIPSLPSILDELYACLNQQCQVKPGPMILLLSIMASSTHSWVRRDCERGVFSTSAEVNKQSSLWIKATEDVIDISHRSTRVSIEGIQGIIIASFVLGNVEGFSRKCRAMYSMALFLAREIGLHCIDHPSVASTANTAQAEMGRRVWWYLAASDCHYLNRPTLCRNIVDRTPIIHAGIPGYGTVMDADTELQMILSETPPFFSMSVAQITQIYQLDHRRAAKIFHQGYMLSSLTHAMHCKIHFAYFTRGYVDPTYASSREVCIRSARKIIQNETRLEQSGLCTAARYRIILLLLGIFMATIVLIMDLCHNKSSPQREKQQGEIADAFRLLEEARDDSETAVKFLDSLMQLLRRHKLPRPKRAGPSPLDSGMGSEQLSTVAAGTYNAANSQPYSQPVMAPLPTAPPSVLGSNDANSMDMGGDGFTNGEDMSSYFNELAQSFEQGVDFDWDDIFAGLDSSFTQGMCEVSQTELHF